MFKWIERNVLINVHVPIDFLSFSEKDWDKFAATLFNLCQDVQENRIQVYNC